MTRRGIRVATWNIHSCIGSDGRHDPARVRAITHDMAADIVALQEVDSRIDGRDGFAELGAAQSVSVDTRTIRTDDGDFGHMLLSRWPIRTSAIHDISVAGREPRAVIDAAIETDLGALRVLSTHLGLARRERRLQAEKIASLVQDATATILIGDFNEATRFGVATRVFSRKLPTLVMRPTFPARRPMFALDRVWCSATLRLERSWVIREARDASDHLPLVADLHGAPDASSR